MGGYMKEYDVVKLNRDIPEKNLKQGLKGTIVMVYNEPDLPIAFEVEFVNSAGETVALETIKEEYLELVSKL
jgi:hypothetical protein